MRLDKYTPRAANEIRAWVEEILGEKLPGGDLLEALKDGVALCRLVNLVAVPGVKYKQSPMPFVQMENISHFLRACQMPPLNLPPHDMFLTVDLYEAKDPAQVIQCIGAFSRRANAINPSAFPRSLGAKSKGGTIMSPQGTGSSQGGGGAIFPPSRERGTSNASNGSSTTWNPLAKGSYASGRISPTKPGATSPSGVSSWSKKSDQGNTAPAWNIHQYGYMGGASQGNMGVTFGGRRQITSASPTVPSFAEKERKRKEEEAEAERLRLQAEEAENKRRVMREAEEERERAEEERRWAEESRRLREKERREAEEEKKRWEEEQRRWKEEEEARAREEKEFEDQVQKQRQRQRGQSDDRLNGQFLSQYQADQGTRSRNVSNELDAKGSESARIKQLEMELERAKARERDYERERLGGSRARSQSKPRPETAAEKRDRSRSRSRPAAARQGTSEAVWQEDERQFLQNQWQNNQEDAAPAPSLPTRSPQPPQQPPRGPVFVKKNNTGPSSRPLPNPTSYQPAPTPSPQPQQSAHTSRTDRYLSSNPAPVSPPTTTYRPLDYTSTSEQDAENSRRLASQQRTKAGGWASKSLLEREMERERERQREWEEGQKQTAAVARDMTQGASPGQSWDVNQYGYIGGDSQNRGGPGLGVGGARRQIIGPRPPP
ncbi:putative calponin homology domain protein [Phaeomoniella chlamydospora]|uniref:Putative calponin homology domain protein n=1 Tax=Phaeomoniella chlamydospora TaxID=158046 RepID=A0A0G2ES56_PHACM|nr:putative calponin homology domain protein [Phaeomoniella chlamydospora]